MRRKKGHGGSGLALGDGRITPADIQQVEFRLAFRGYDERDVDAFLDRITEDLSAYLEENQRLRSGGAVAPAAVAGNDEAGREAERVLAAARDEAAAILRRAEQAAAIGAATGGAPDARASVTPFLNTEREFLQSLGTLVQTHAEEIKQMVLALRARQGAPGGATSARSEPVPAPPVLEGPDPTPPPEPEVAFEAATAAEIRERIGPADDPDGPDDDPEPEAAPAEEEPVILEAATEPAFSSEGAPAGERRERSLRELFWGED